MKKLKDTKKQQKTKQITNSDGMQPPNIEAQELEGDVLTTNQGVVLSDNHNSFKIGARGPTLIEDFILREKITSFDHERIPERAVHARGSGAFGTFECTKDMSKITEAGFLNAKGKKTPVMVRFSTANGSRGSMDTARDVRGFATKFYTDQGNFDLVGNNIPVFFIQDAMKFPDLVHALKPEPDNEIPQAQSAHDTFWDFISLMPESLHMILWTMSDRALPRSYRMMEGFGVHSFRFVNAKGEATFVKFHWKPKLGVHSLLWEESQQLGGLDPDFHRRDLHENIDNGCFPEWDLGVQLIPESDEFKFSFDLLDPTKLVPEELVPVQIIGTMVLNRNPDNFFAEIEQVAFHPGNVVPGIDFTNDPLLQGRLISYTDTQLTRLGGPNFHELPVNRPLVDMNNNQRDGFSRQLIPKGKVAYEPNSLQGGCPFHAGADMSRFVHYAEHVSASKVRARSSSFGDHLSQAQLFYDSQTPTEQQHIKSAFIFELSKVQAPNIREKMVGLLRYINIDLSEAIARHLQVVVASREDLPPNAADPDNNILPSNRSLTVAASEEKPPKKERISLPRKSSALSMVLTNPKKVEGRKVAFLMNDFTSMSLVHQMQKQLEDHQITVEWVVPNPRTSGSVAVSPKIEKALCSAPSHHYDAVIVLCDLDGYATGADHGAALRFVGQAFKHCKTIGVVNGPNDLVNLATQGLAANSESFGMTQIKESNLESSLAELIDDLRQHRHWGREALAAALPY